MRDLAEIERALKELPADAKWEVAQWLLDELHNSSTEISPPNEKPIQANANLPDYAARRRQIFGDQTIPNMVLSARAEDRW